MTASFISTVIIKGADPRSLFCMSKVIVRKWANLLKRALTTFLSWIQLIQDASGLAVSVLPTVRVADEFLARTGYRGQEIGNVWGRRNMLEQSFGMRLYDGALLAKVSTFLSKKTKQKRKKKNPPPPPPKKKKWKNEKKKIKVKSA